MSYPRIGQAHQLIPNEGAVLRLLLPCYLVQPHHLASLSFGTSSYLLAFTSFSAPFSSKLIPAPRMAADSKTVNGNYGAQYPYGQAESFVPSQGLNASNGNTPAGMSGEYAAATTTLTSSEPTGDGEASKAPSKDEVGWYFVESYYTTLSKNPETLYVRHRMV